MSLLHFRALRGGSLVVTGPVLSGAIYDTLTSTSVYIRVTTNTANGTLYVVLTTSATAPSSAQIKAEQDHTGATATYATNLTITTIGQKWRNPTGLSAGTYYAHWIHTNASAADSNIISSASIAITAPDSTAPTLTTAVGTTTGSTTATIGATTDEGNGTFYGVVTTSATQPTVVQIQTGLDHTGAAAAFDDSVSVTSTGAKTLTATGLTASTAYYAHLVHTDAAANNSNRISSAQFTTDAAGSIVDGGSNSFTISGAGNNLSTAYIEFLGGASGPIESATVPGTRTTSNDWNSTNTRGWEDGGTDGPHITDNRSFNGTNSLGNLDHNASTHYQYGTRWDVGAGGFKSLFIRETYYFHNPLGLNNSTGQIKKFRFSGDGGSGTISDGNEPMLVQSRDIGGGSRFEVKQGGDSYYTSAGGGTAGNWWVDNTWCTQEILITPDSTAGGSDAQIQWWIRREDTGAILTYGTVTSADIWRTGFGSEPYRYAVFQGYMGNWSGGDTSTLEYYWDRDIYIAWNPDTSTAPKFLLLGDASTYATCTNFTICPYTSWASDNITATINQGVHANLTGKYWYAMSAPGTPINTTGVALA